MRFQPFSDTGRSLSESWASKDPLNRFTAFGWRGGISLILGFSLLSFLLCGYFVIYWRSADMDFMIVYSALALNDGAKRAFFDHPAYLTILSVEAWFRLLHHLRFLDAWTLSAIPPASNLPAFDAAMTSAVRAGRIVALLTGSGLVLAFAALARRIVTDWRIAVCAVFAFTLSGGVQMHLRVLRSEMVAGGFCILALMLLIIVARRGTACRPIVLAAAGSLCVLALENKVHAILLIAVLPALVLPFGTSATVSAAFWREGVRAWLAALAASVVALFAIAMVWPLISAGLDPAAAAAAGLKPLLLSRFGLYQIALLAWIGLCMITFAAIWRVSLPESIAAISCVAVGASLGLLALDIQYNIADAVVVLNPIEKMMMYVDAPQAFSNVQGAAGLLFSGIVGTLERYTFVLFSSPRPTVFLTWLVIPGVLYAWRRGKKQVALQATFLMLAAIGIDALGVRRGLKVEYFVLTDPLIIIAGMILLDSISGIRFHKRAFPIGAALVLLHVCVSQAEPAKLVLKRKGPENICEWHQTYMPQLPLPWCSPV